MVKRLNIKYLRTTLLFLLIILIGSIVILSLVPPVSKDALVHHLAVPKLYIKKGGMYEIPFMDFSYYPMNLDMLYMIPIYFGNDIVPKFIHFGFGLLTAFLIFYYLRRRTDSIYGLLGAIFFLSIPIVIKLSTNVYVDLGEMFFSFGALLLMLKWIRSGFRLKFLLFSGISCGLALGTKYNGLITLALITLFIPFFYTRHFKNKKAPGSLRSVIYGIIFFLVSMLVYSPWMIRNYHWKGNPIYPLYNRIFNPIRPLHQIHKDTDSDEIKIRQNRGFFTYRSMIYHESGFEIALLPIRIFFQGRDGDPQYFDGKLNPFLFFLPFFAFFRLKDDPEYLRREKKVMLTFAVLFLFIAFFTAVLRIRYISPIIPTLVVLAVLGLKRMSGIIANIPTRAGRKFEKLFLIILISISLAFNWLYMMEQFKIIDPFPLFTGKIRREDYITRFIPEYPALNYINNNLPANSLTYFIFLGKRGYYCDKDYIFDINIIKNLIERAQKPEDILRGLRGRKITHLLVYYPLFERWMNDNFLLEKQELVRQFFHDYAKLIFYEKGFGVNVLKSLNNDNM